MRRVTAAHLAWLVGLLLALWLPTSSHAWGTLADMDAPPSADRLSAGAGWMSLPRSPEGSHQRYGFMPALDYFRQDGWFLSTQHGAGWQTPLPGEHVVGARAWPQGGRARQDEGANAPRLGPRLQAQVFANLQLHPALWWQSAVSHGAGTQRQGWQGESGFSTGLPTSSGWIGLGVAVTYANAAFKRDYLGKAQDGWADWSWRLGVSHRLDSLWRVEGQYLQARTWPADDRPHLSRRLMLTLLRELP